MTKKIIDKLTAVWKGRCVKLHQIDSCQKFLTENMYPKSKHKAPNGQAAKAYI